MAEFTPCPGCDEPEACDIVKRCLEPTRGVTEALPHHCAPEDIAALLRWLDAINDPQQEAMPSWENTDWRGKAGVIARVIRHLRGAAPGAKEEQRADVAIADFDNGPLSDCGEA